MENKEAVEVLREMAETEYEESKALIAAGWKKAGNYHLKKSNALKEALLALECNDCIAFGYWLVNAPNKELYSKKWIEQKYKQYIKEKEVLENE